MLMLVTIEKLLDSLGDKDEYVRTNIEMALSRIAEKHPHETIKTLCEYRTKNKKLSDVTIVILIRQIKQITFAHTPQINDDDTLTNTIDLIIGEMIKSTDNNLSIQLPGMEALVSIGRHRCDKVMDKLSVNIVPNQVAHFGVLHCVGMLAAANATDSIKFVKPIMKTLLTTLPTIKQDHLKQAYALIFGRFSDAMAENVIEKNECESIGVELAIAYNHLFTTWLPNREPKVSTDILYALTSMFPLLPPDEIDKQSEKIIPLTLAMYRRSSDRISVTQFLASVLTTLIATKSDSVRTYADTLIISLFDLVCVNPDYDKPQTVKGHYEVLRCFDVLRDLLGDIILQTLLTQLKNNNERERIKSLLVLTHLTNSSEQLVATKTVEFIQCLKEMMPVEKSLKMKMTLLKTIVAFAQKGFVNDRDVIGFIIRHSCRYNKCNTEYGTIQEHEDLVQACNSAMCLLATVGTIDTILKQELLIAFVRADYSDACSSFAKCLASLFAKDRDVVCDATSATARETDDKATPLPSAEVIFVRCLALLGNLQYSERIHNVLQFLKSYCVNLNKYLVPIWTEHIPKIADALGGHDNRAAAYFGAIFKFVRATIEDIDNERLAESLAHKVADQMAMYTGALLSPASPSPNEYKIPNMADERGMLLKVLGVCLCYVTDAQTVTAKIDLIISIARQERLDKSDGGTPPLNDAATALGYASLTHLDVLLKRLRMLIDEEGSRKTGGFFAGLNFINNAHREADAFKVRLLAVKSYQAIIENSTDPTTIYEFDEKIVPFVLKLFADTQDQQLKELIIGVLLTGTQKSVTIGYYDLKTRVDLLNMIARMPIDATENLELFAKVLRLATTLFRLRPDDKFNAIDFLTEICRKFFACTQNLKSKFNSTAEDEHNSYLAKHLNESLPELNCLFRVFIEQNPMPATLDDITHMLRVWFVDSNNEVRICVGHVMNGALDVYTKSIRIGSETSTKFNQTGEMLGKVVPRCTDPSATVRTTAVDIMRRILEIACIYETLTIPDEHTDWTKSLQEIRTNIVTDDPKDIYTITGEIAKVLAMRLSNFQYLSFCKTILVLLDDPEQSSAVGALVVLKFFIQNKGGELVHAVPELVNAFLLAIKNNESDLPKKSVLKAMLELAKHHPKLVSNEMLAQPLPFEENVIEFWQAISVDAELSSFFLDDLLAMWSSSCLCESVDNKSDRPKMAAVQPFAIISIMRVLFASEHIQAELKSRFARIFSALLVNLATYSNILPPAIIAKSLITALPKQAGQKKKVSVKLNQLKEPASQNPCQIVYDTMQRLLTNLKMEQPLAALLAYPNLPQSTDLGQFIEMLTPLAGGLGHELAMNSAEMRELAIAVSKYVSSSYDNQRIASVGLFAQWVPLKPCGEISSVIMLHLQAALSDPNALVRGLAIRGLACVAQLNAHDIDKYSETCLTALLKGIDDHNTGCLLNIPLDSMRGLSQILSALPSENIEMFQVSLAIRIRPFFENSATEIREAAILLFGDLCLKKISDKTDSTSSDALREQLFANFFSLLLHLAETDKLIVKCCKKTLKIVCNLLNSPNINAKAQNHLVDYGQLNYDNFIVDFIRTMCTELPDFITDFIESCLPYLKSTWPEIRGNAAIIIGILQNQSSGTHKVEIVSSKVSQLLQDEQSSVRVRAARALGYIFGDI